MANKKFNTAEIITIVFCSLGCLLMTAPLFLENGKDYFPIAIALNGIGIMAMLYNRK